MSDWYCVSEIVRSYTVAVAETGQTVLGLEQWPKKINNFEEEAISEILLADMSWESGAKAGDVRRLF